VFEDRRASAGLAGRALDDYIIDSAGRKPAPPAAQRVSRLKGQILRDQGRDQGDLSIVRDDRGRVRDDLSRVRDDLSDDRDDLDRVQDDLFDDRDDLSRVRDDLSDDRDDLTRV
jgi:hypothetical protein